MCSGGFGSRRPGPGIAAAHVGEDEKGIFFALMLLFLYLLFIVILYITIMLLLLLLYFLLLL